MNPTKTALRLIGNLPHQWRPKTLSAAAQIMNLIKFGDRRMFHQVYFEISTDCNRGCVYCPVSRKTDVSAKMLEGTFMRVIHELRDIGWSGSIGYHYLSEPMKDDRLEWFITHTVKINPNAYPVLFTNGDYLTMERADRLVHAGLFRATVSRHAPYSVKWDNRIQEIHRRWPHIFNTYDIANNLQNFSEIIVRRRAVKPTTCKAPTNALPIRYNGDVTSCCCDYRREISFGNVNTTSLMEIWKSDKFSKTRKFLLDGGEPWSICKGCTMIGRE